MTRATSLALAAAVLATTIALTAPAAADATSSRVACIDGALVDGAVDGVPYSSAGVTGSGTAEDPFVIADRLLDLATEVAGPQVLLRNCDHVRVERVQVYAGIIPRQPACRGDWAADPAHYAPYGILIEDSSDVLVTGSILGHARLAAVRVRGESDVRLQGNDFPYNFGHALWIDDGALVNSTMNRFMWNGFSSQDYTVLIGAAVYVNSGAHVTIWGDNYSASHNLLVVDKSTVTETHATVTDAAFGDTMGYAAHVVLPGRPKGDTCSQNDQVWWTRYNPYRPGPFDEDHYHHVNPGNGTQSTSATLSAPSLAPLSSESPRWEDDPLMIVKSHRVWWGLTFGPNGLGSLQPGVEISDLVDYRYWLPAPPAPALAAGAFPGPAKGVPPPIDPRPLMDLT